MTTNKGASQASPECCMCGDCGLSNELFQCQICHFRSQHRYCSNLYPKAESYQVCNWCLTLDTKEKSQNSSNNSSSSNKNNNSEEDSKNGVKNNKKVISSNQGGGLNDVNVKGSLRGTLQLQQVINCPIKKQRSPERSSPPSSTTRARRIVTSGKLLEDKLIRRTKSEEISNVRVGPSKQVFRNKVRRYKLLDEVSS